MADFELSIDEAAFESRGVKPVFDENLYGQLLDEIIPDYEDIVSVNVAPDDLWWNEHPAIRYKTLGAFQHRRTLRLMGNYDCVDKQIDVYAQSNNEEEVNTTLLHETKHFIDDLDGELIEGWKARRRFEYKFGTALMLGAGVVAATTRLIFPELAPIVAVSEPVAVLPIVLKGRRIAYLRSPHEVAARQFAGDPAITSIYGQIIKYKQA